MPFADLPDARLHYRIRRPGRRAGARAVQFARHRPRDVGRRRWPRSRAAIPRAALRHARARPILGARRDRTRSSASAAMSWRCSIIWHSTRVDVLRAVDGRHDRHVARHPCAGAHARLVLANTAARIAPPELWNARIDKVNAGGMAAISDARARALVHPGVHRARAGNARGDESDDGAHAGGRLRRVLRGGPRHGPARRSRARSRRRRS